MTAEIDPKHGVTKDIPKPGETVDMDPKPGKTVDMGPKPGKKKEMDPKP